MSRIVRITRTLRDRGLMVRENEVVDLIEPTTSFYQSLYYYSEDALEYFKKNKNSIKGFKGDVSTPYVVFDIDSKDLEVSKQNTVILIDWLKDQGLYTEYAAKIAFSGSKGFHLTLNTAYEFTPKELKSLCMYISSQVPFVEEADFKRVDPSIYNTNRQFRIVNTVNKKSGLFKIEMVESELRNCTMDKIKEMAKEPQKTYPFESKIDDKPIRAILMRLKEDSENKYEQPRTNVISTFMGADIKRKKCIDIIQEGEMRDGESNAGLIRLASHYRRQGYTQEQCRDKLVEAAKARKKKYPLTNDIDDGKLDNEILDPVYSTEGYIFTCDDWFLKMKCEGACEVGPKQAPREPQKPIRAFKPSTPTPTLNTGFGGFKQPIKPRPKNKDDIMSVSGFKTIKQSAESFKAFAEDLPKYRVLTGIDELDEVVRMLPSGLVIINARPGTGKTTLMLNIAENTSRAGKHTLVYSIDMAEDEFTQKHRSKSLKISPDDVLDLYFSTDEEARELQAEGDKVSNESLKNTYINYDSGITSDRIDRDLTAFKEAGVEISLVVIDFLQKMEGCGDFSSPKTGDMLMGLKSVQAKHKVCMIGLSQIPRGQGRINEETPVLTAAAAKGGSVYEENASIIINLWRPMKFYCSDYGSEDKYMGYMIAKNRMGECKEGVLYFNGAISEIRGLSGEERENYEITVEERRQREQPRVNKGFKDV